MVYVLNLWPRRRHQKPSPHHRWHLYMPGPVESAVKWQTRSTVHLKMSFCCATLFSCEILPSFLIPLQISYKLKKVLKMCSAAEISAEVRHAESQS